MQIVSRISTSPKDNYDSDVGVALSASLREYTMDRRSIISLCAITLGVMHEVGRSCRCKEPVRLLRSKRPDQHLDCDAVRDPKEKSASTFHARD